MNNWYQHITENLKTAARGIMAVYLDTVIKNDLLDSMYHVKSNSLDVDVLNEVEKWVQNTFQPFLLDISVSLEVANTPEALSDSVFAEKVNKTIQALEVSRAYYKQEGNAAFVSNLEEIAVLKAIICEEMAECVANAYILALENFGELLQGKTITSTQANTFEGTRPEAYTWRKQNIIVNHLKFENVALAQENPENDNAPKCEKKNQYLPWVFTGAFFLIAWSAAAKN